MDEGTIAEGLDTVLELCGAERGIVFLVAADGATLVARVERRSMGAEEKDEIVRHLARAAAGPASIVERWQRLQAERAHIDAEESALIREALATSSGVVARAARELGVA